MELFAKYAHVEEIKRLEPNPCTHATIDFQNLSGIIKVLHALIYKHTSGD